MTHQPNPAWQPAPPTSGMAIASLVASILGVTLVPTIGSIVGVILGYMAGREIAESGGTMGGEGLAKAGIIIGWVGIGLSVLGICALIAVFGGAGLCVSLGNIQ